MGCVGGKSLYLSLNLTTWPWPWPTKLGGGFKNCLFSFLSVEMVTFDEHIFQMG